MHNIDGGSIRQAPESQIFNLHPQTTWQLSAQLNSWYMYVMYVKKKWQPKFSRINNLWQHLKFYDLRIYLLANIKCHEVRLRSEWVVERGTIALLTLPPPVLLGLNYSLQLHRKWIPPELAPSTISSSYLRHCATDKLSFSQLAAVAALLVVRLVRGSILGFPHLRWNR